MQKMFTARVMWIVLLLLVCSLGFAGCGYLSGSDAHAAAPTTPSIQKDPKQCGTLDVDPTGRLLDPNSAPQKADCFEKSYTSCQMAMLTFNRGGIDTISKQTFLIMKKRGYCQITDLVQHQVIPAPFKTQGLYNCVGVDKTKDTLVIKNCETIGTITIPLTAI